MKTKQSNRKLLLRRFLLGKEVIMVGLALISLAGLMLDIFGRLTVSHLAVFEAYEVCIGLVFLGEFMFEMYYAKDRKKYWTHHWYYLPASVPIPATAFDVLRTLRILRLVMLFKIFAQLRYEQNTWLFQKAARP